MSQLDILHQLALLFKIMQTPALSFPILQLDPQRRLLLQRPHQGHSLFVPQLPAVAVQNSIPAVWVLLYYTITPAGF